MKKGSSQTLPTLAKVTNVSRARGACVSLTPEIVAVAAVEAPKLRGSTSLIKSYSTRCSRRCEAAMLPSLAKLPLSIGVATGEKRERSPSPAAEAGPSEQTQQEQLDIWYQFTEGVGGDTSYDAHVREFDASNDYTELVDVVMDIDLFLRLAGIGDYVIDPKDLSTLDDAFWNGRDVSQAYRDEKLEFTPPPVLLQMKMTRDTKYGSDEGRLYKVIRHEGRHRAWVAKYVKGYQHIVVSVGANLSTDPRWFRDSMRELKAGDVVEQQDISNKKLALTFAVVTDGIARAGEDGAYEVWVESLRK